MQHGLQVNTRKNFSTSFLENEIGKLIQKLSFTDDELVLLDAQTRTDVALFEVKRHTELDKMDRQKRKIREDLTYLRNNKLSLLKAGVYSPESYLEEEMKLNNELITLQDKEQISDISMHEVIKDIIKVSELLKTLYFCYEKGNSAEKEPIIKNVILPNFSFSGTGVEI